MFRWQDLNFWSDQCIILVVLAGLSEPSNWIYRNSHWGWGWREEAKIGSVSNKSMTYFFFVHNFVTLFRMTITRRNSAYTFKIFWLCPCLLLHLRQIPFHHEFPSSLTVTLYDTLFPLTLTNLAYHGIVVQLYNMDGFMLRFK